LLNVVPETIREEMLGDLSFGTFGYWPKLRTRRTQVSDFSQPRFHKRTQR